MIDIKQVQVQYNQVSIACDSILKELLMQLNDFVSEYDHIDRIYGRIKSKSSFILKVRTKPYAYNPPFSQVEDFIGIRILAVFPEVSDQIACSISQGFCANVEDYYKEPPNPNQFGYEGHQIIQSIPVSLMPSKSYDDFPKVFEIQVKTLLMHAWAEVEHVLRYEKIRSGQSVPVAVEKRLAWIAASSWGSDRIITELYANIKTIKQQETTD